MKKTCMCIGLAAVVSVYAGLAVSGGASVEQGKALFNDSGLGGSTNEKSCASCHPEGRGLEQSGEKDNLAQVINGCIAGPLRGQALDKESMEMQSLELYIKSLEK